jgi:hypothetical protein
MAAARAKAAGIECIPAVAAAAAEVLGWSHRAAEPTAFPFRDPLARRASDAATNDRNILVMLRQPAIWLEGHWAALTGDVGLTNRATVPKTRQHKSGTNNQVTAGSRQIPHV